MVSCLRCLGHVVLTWWLLCALVACARDDPTPAATGHTGATEATPAPAATVTTAPSVGDKQAPVAPLAVAKPAPKPPSPAQPAARPLYLDRALTTADLATRTLRELSLLRNTIFARQGNTFIKPWLDAHFRAQSWYAPRPKGKWGKPSARDLANAVLIARHEAKLTAKELDERAEQVRARLKAAKEQAASDRFDDDRMELRLLSARRGKWLGGDGVAQSRRTPLEDPTLLDQQLAVGQIALMSRRDLRLLRNTIYARHGYQFRSELLSSYFSSTDWYKAHADFSTKDLTAVDQRNLKLVRSVEDRHGGPLSDAAHGDAIGWFGGA